MLEPLLVFFLADAFFGVGAPFKATWQNIAVAVNQRFAFFAFNNRFVFEYLRFVFAFRADDFFRKIIAAVRSGTFFV